MPPAARPAPHLLYMMLPRAPADTNTMQAPHVDRKIQTHTRKNAARATSGGLGGGGGGADMGRIPCCDKNSVKRGQWTPDEDDKLHSCLAARDRAAAVLEELPVAVDQLPAARPRVH
ncbi:hypothetical protein ZWY2020_012494 [Hordeum vulgare]|nr:hypothetical protein ZWY2020_012494 [Hordeum vulgare]